MPSSRRQTARFKVSLRSPLMLPRLALVDPELTVDLPPGLTASTGLDALTQLIEPYVSIRANPLSDGFCTEGIRRVACALRPAFHDGSNAAAREDMALASLLGGLALANAGLGAVHGFAAPIGGMFSAPHGQSARRCCLTSLQRTWRPHASGRQRERSITVMPTLRSYWRRSHGHARRRYPVGARSGRGIRHPAATHLWRQFRVGSHARGEGGEG